MKGLLAASQAIDWINQKVGQSIAWLILLVTLISAGNALSRKIINLSSNGLLEIQWYLFGAVFLLAAGYTLLTNSHVRIDVIASRFGPRTQAWIDLLGYSLFTLPLVGFMVWHGWDFAYQSFLINEYSADQGGLLRWPAKALISLGFALLGLQIISEMIKKLNVLRSAP